MPFIFDSALPLDDSLVPALHVGAKGSVRNGRKLADGKIDGTSPKNER
jgi:hypothetical protein